MSVLETAIGWLAPPQCIVCGTEGLALCGACANNQITPFGDRCWRCSALTQNGRTCVSCRSAGGPHSVWITTSYENTASALIQTYKFGQLRAASVPLAKLMAQTFLKANDSIVDYLVVPIPTATKRVRERGFDHSALLATHVSRHLGLSRSQALARLDQARQLGAAREQRFTQTEGKYYARNRSQLSGRRILLIDDVVTTGSTLIAATKALRLAGAAQVDALVFAKKL